MLNKFTRTLTVVTGFILLGSLTACAPTSTPDAKKTEKVEVVENRVCPKVSPDENFGDVIPLDERKNENGTYCHVTISPEAIESSFTAEAITPELMEQAGFDDLMVQQAHEHSVKFIAEELADSSIADSVGDGYAWYTQVGNPNILPLNREYFDGLVMDEGKAPNEIGYIITNHLPTLIYDGTPRLDKMTIKLGSTEPQQSETNGKPVTRIKFVYDVNIEFEAKNTEIVKSYLRQHPEVTEENLKADQPELFKKGTTKFTFEGVANHWRDASDVDKFSGIGFFGHLKLANGFEIV